MAGISFLNKDQYSERPGIHEVKSSFKKKNMSLL